MYFLTPVTCWLFFLTAGRCQAFSGSLKYAHVPQSQPQGLRGHVPPGPRASVAYRYDYTFLDRSSNCLFVYFNLYCVCVLQDSQIDQHFVDGTFSVKNKNLFSWNVRWAMKSQSVQNRTSSKCKMAASIYFEVWRFLCGRENPVHQQSK